MSPERRQRPPRPSEDRPAPGALRDDLGPYVEADEAEALERVADLLAAEDPHPRAAFRAALHARLRDEIEAQRLPLLRPRRLRLLVAAYASSGFALIALAALGAAGTGPVGI